MAATQPRRSLRPEHEGAAMKEQRALVLAIVGLIPVGAEAKPPLQCTLTAADKAANARLSFDAFDQKGVLPSTWRALSNRGCWEAASEAMESYQIESSVTDKVHREDLAFHLGQSLAKSGRKQDAAIAVASAAPGPGTDSHGLDWNTYVTGTWAYLVRDKPKLQNAYQRLSKEAGRGNQFNAAALSGLIHCFNRPYSVAYARSCRIRSN